MQDAGITVTVYFVVLTSAKTVLKATNRITDATSYRDIYREYHPDRATTLEERMVTI